MKQSKYGAYLSTLNSLCRRAGSTACNFFADQPPIGNIILVGSVPEMVVEAVKEQLFRLLKRRMGRGRTGR